MLRYTGHGRVWLHILSLPDLSGQKGGGGQEERVVRTGMLPPFFAKMDFLGAAEVRRALSMAAIFSAYVRGGRLLCICFLEM